MNILRLGNPPKSRPHECDSRDAHKGNGRRFWNYDHLKLVVRTAGGKIDPEISVVRAIRAERHRSIDRSQYTQDKRKTLSRSQVKIIKLLRKALTPRSPLEVIVVLHIARESASDTHSEHDIPIRRTIIKQRSAHRNGIGWS